MTIDTNKLRALRKAGTTGEWRVVGLPWNHGDPWISTSEDPHQGAFIADLTPPSGDRDARPDAALIAAAVNAIEPLCDEVDRLARNHRTAQRLAEDLSSLVQEEQAEVRRLKDALDEANARAEKAEGRATAAVDALRGVARTCCGPSPLKGCAGRSGQ